MVSDHLGSRLRWAFSSHHRRNRAGPARRCSGAGHSTPTFSRPHACPDADGLSVSPPAVGIDRRTGPDAGSARRVSPVASSASAVGAVTQSRQAVRSCAVAPNVCAPSCCLQGRGGEDRDAKRRAAPTIGMPATSTCPEPGHRPVRRSEPSLALSRALGRYKGENPPCLRRGGAASRQGGAKKPRCILTVRAGFRPGSGPMRAIDISLWSGLRPRRAVSRGETERGKRVTPMHRLYLQFT